MSVREQAILALLDYLKTEIPNITIKRNYVLPSSIPDTGLIIVRDGEIGDPSIVLSPPRYTYYHQVNIEVIVQDADDKKREHMLDAHLITLGQALQQAKTLNGAVDALITGTPQLVTEPIEGAATLKMANVPITLEYMTDNPLL